MNELDEKLYLTNSTESKRLLTFKAISTSYQIGDFLEYNLIMNWSSECSAIEEDDQMLSESDENV